jgi:hypothetical protein
MDAGLATLVDLTSATASIAAPTPSGSPASSLKVEHGTLFESGLSGELLIRLGCGYKIEATRL